MDAVKYIKERVRLCKSNTCNEHCPLNNATVECNNSESCQDFCDFHPEEAVSIVERWSKEHPRKTNLDKIREMFPEMIAVSSMGENDSVEMLIFYKDYLDREYKEKEDE